MSRYTGPAYKRSRRVGISTLENGKELVKKPYGPGQHGNGRKGKLSNYGVQLVEKQKIRFIYGISEKQLKKTFERAAKLKGIHGENILKLLESRLDNIVYRMGLASTRSGARQFVNHSQFDVNGKKCDIPSYLVKPGDVISVREIKKDNATIKANVEENASRPTPDWLERDLDNLTGKVVRLASREDIDLPVEEHLIVELYSK